MKFAKFFLSLTFCVLACNQSTSPDDIVLRATFTLTDTLGQTVSQLHSGENFYLSFFLTNTSNDTLTYYRGSSAPPILFQIVKDDSVVASSADGYAFLMFVSQGRLAPEQKLDYDWKAPTTPPQYPKVVLEPGYYKAAVLHPDFNEARTEKISPISFELID